MRNIGRYELKIKGRNIHRGTKPGEKGVNLGAKELRYVTVSIQCQQELELVHRNSTDESIL